MNIPKRSQNILIPKIIKLVFLFIPLDIVHLFKCSLHIADANTNISYLLLFQNSSIIKLLYINNTTSLILNWSITSTPFFNMLPCSLVYGKRHYKRDEPQLNKEEFNFIKWLYDAYLTCLTHLK